MFDSFRAILSKKTDSNELLELIKSVPASFFEKYIEILEKARSRHKGLQANFPVRDFGVEMDPELEPEMIRDAIGHHVSHYKASLARGNEHLANKHAKQAMTLMNLADTVQDHSHGKLNIDYIPTHPWERNKYQSKYDDTHEKVKTGKAKPGDWVTIVKGLNYSKLGNDYSFLRQNPHPYYDSETNRHGHKGPYPFEQVRINGKYIHVEDLDPSKKKDYEPHPFDSHPIVEQFADNPKNRTPEHDQKYALARDQWHDKLPHINKYFDKVEKRQGDAHLGLKSSPPVHNLPAPPETK